MRLSWNRELIVVELPPAERKTVLAHLLALPAADRRLRFGFCSTEAAVRRYVQNIRFHRDAVFGAFIEPKLPVGVAHVAYESGVAELGLSVLPLARRQGVGAALLARTTRHARSRGAPELRMHFLPENAALIALANRAGMHLYPHADEPKATLALAKGDGSELFAEAIEAILGMIDLGFRRAAVPARRAVTSA